MREDSIQFVKKNNKRRENNLICKLEFLSQRSCALFRNVVSNIKGENSDCFIASLSLYVNKLIGVQKQCLRKLCSSRLTWTMTRKFRTLLCYSPISEHLSCFICKLFSHWKNWNRNPYICSGYKDRKNANLYMYVCNEQ